MKYLIIFLFMGIVLISGCVTLSESVPKDLELKYEWGACHMDWGWNILKMNAKGEVNLEITMETIFRKQNQYIFTEEEMLRIYQEIMGNNFFDLSNKYDNPNIIDGSCSNLQVTAEGKKHKVSISNEEVKQIKRITQKILNILESKDSNWDVLNMLDMCNDARLACKTDDFYKEFSLEWQQEVHQTNISCSWWNTSCQSVELSAAWQKYEINMTETCNNSRSACKTYESYQKIPCEAWNKTWTICENIGNSQNT